MRLVVGKTAYRVSCVVCRVVAASFSTSGNEISNKTRDVMWIRKRTRCVCDRQFF